MMNHYSFDSFFKRCEDDALLPATDAAMIEVPYECLSEWINACTDSLHNYHDETFVEMHQIPQQNNAAPVPSCYDIINKVSSTMYAEHSINQMMSPESNYTEAWEPEPGLPAPFSEERPWFARSPEHYDSSPDTYAGGDHISFLTSIMRHSASGEVEMPPIVSPEVPSTAKFLSSYFLSDLEERALTSAKKLDFENAGSMDPTSQGPSSFRRDHKISRRATISCSSPHRSLFDLPESNIPLLTTTPSHTTSFAPIPAASHVDSFPYPDLKRVQVGGKRRQDDTKREEVLINNKKTRKNIVSTQDLNPPYGILDNLTSALVRNPRKKLVTGFTYAIICQLEESEFAEIDRRGNRSYLPIGFKGVRCRHCEGKGRTGRYFPSSLKSFADAEKTLLPIHRHLVNCSKCPEDIKVKIDRLFYSHREELVQKNKRHGGQRAFYRHIWNCLHPTGEPQLRMHRRTSM
jgi:hypothetical protein